MSHVIKNISLYFTQSNTCRNCVLKTYWTGFIRLGTKTHDRYNYMEVHAQPRNITGQGKSCQIWLTDRQRNQDVKGACIVIQHRPSLWQTYAKTISYIIFKLPPTNTVDCMRFLLSAVNPYKVRSDMSGVNVWYKDKTAVDPVQVNKHSNIQI